MRYTDLGNSAAGRAGTNADVSPNSYDSGLIIDRLVSRWRWLAYKHTGEGEDALTYLWAARADGSETKQVDTEPIYDDPLWSGKA